jgi:response regulator NasT
MKRTWSKVLSAARALTAEPPQLKYYDLFPNTRRLKVLLVEDDEPDAYIIANALSSNPRVGEVLVAEDGVKALELVDKGWIRPDLAIIDLHMPRKDGFSLLQDFAAMENGGFRKVILTSSSARADVQIATHCGAVEFFTKPHSRKKLAAALDRVIENAA